jgi:hypothetical protein
LHFFSLQCPSLDVMVLERHMTNDVSIPPASAKTPGLFLRAARIAEVRVS